LDLLDGLPLAIAQAAAFLQETGTEIQKYTEFYEQKWQELMESRDWEGAPLQDYPDRSVWTTWAISFGAIKEMSGAVANLLLLWAFLDSKDLWYGLFTAAYSASAGAATSLSEWIGDIASSELEFTKAIGLLRNYSLIEDVQGLGSYATHPVVHRWAYHFQGEDSRLQLAQLAIIVVGWAVPRISSQDYSTLQRRLLSHAQACSRWIVINETQQNYNDESGSIKIKLAKQRVIVLDAVMQLGVLYRHQGKLDEAEKMYQRALEGQEKALGPGHTSTLQTVSNLGILYTDQGKLDEAEKMYQRALEGQEKALGPEHTSTLQTVNNLGNLYTHQSKLDEAEKMYQRALEGYEKALGPEHTSTLQTVNNLGNLYTHQSKLDEAEKMYQRALEGKEKALGPEHTSTLQTVSNLGNLYANQGKLDEAEKMYQRALEGYEKALGANFKTYIPALNTIWGLASVFERQADSAKAKILYSKALNGYEKAVGPDHPRSRELRDKLRALDNVIENDDLVKVREPVNVVDEEALDLSARGRPSISKRHRLLNKLGLR
jgi:tetratricopeptide (TPR) repeat protein